jgi:DNA-binding beta-propeller fold protein YncE
MFKARLKSAAILGLAGAALAAILTFAQEGQPPAKAPEMVPASPGTRGVPAGNYNASARTAADEALPTSFARDETFFKFPKTMKLGGASGIAIDKDGHSIWIYQRCGGQDVCIGTHDASLWKFDSNGNFVKAFLSDQIVYPHGLYVAPDGNLWVTDLQSNVDFSGQPDGYKGRNFPTDLKPNGADVLEFSPEGKLLMRLGTPGVYGTDNAHFSQPSAVAVDSTGSIYVADGHDSKPANNRIMKFDKTGKFIKSWPTCQPTDAKQIDCSHALAIDSQGRVFVGNRGNSVIDIFDQDGKLLDQWKQFGKPSGLFIDKNDVLYVGDSESSVREGNAFVRGIHVGDARTGAVKAFLPDPLGNPVPWNPLRGTTGAEGVAAADGYIYVSQVTPPGLARYSPK